MKNINDMDIEIVKIIGKIDGKKIELLMDKETFFKWKDKLKYGKSK